MRKKLTLEYIKQKTKELVEGYECLATEYINAHTKYNNRCDKGHIYETSWNNFQQGNRCPKCSDEKFSKDRRHDYKFIKSEFEKRGWKLLSKEYKNNRQRLEVKCPKDHLCNITYDKFKQGQGCRKCYFESNKGKGSHFYKGKIKVKCEYCGKVKKVFPCRIDRCEKHFCNKQCYDLWRLENIVDDTYCSIWSDNEYKESIKERDGYKCQNRLCWNTSNRLCIHHIDYNKENCNPFNLITLCNSCNIRANKNRKFWQAYYTLLNFLRRR